jgi:hypothetical protein
MSAGVSSFFKMPSIGPPHFTAGCRLQKPAALYEARHFLESVTFADLFTRECLRFRIEIKFDSVPGTDLVRGDQIREWMDDQTLNRAFQMSRAVFHVCALLRLRCASAGRLHWRGCERVVALMKTQRAEMVLRYRLLN